MQGDEVLILGAGFSKAVSDLMPLTDELGSHALEAAQLQDDRQIHARPFGPGFSFENWLSLLAEDQPHLTEAKNLANAALFARLREAIFAVLTLAQQNVFLDAAPPWLPELVAILHQRRAKVITLNYDTIVEVALSSLGLKALSGDEVISTYDILHNMPPLPTTFGFRFGGPVKASFRLLKLHGSIDWWAAPRDPSGATLAREELTSRFGSSNSVSDEDRRQQLPGREPFIIPPASAKSSYYQFPYVRELWRSAFDALRSASRVSLVGYSLPQADLVMSGLLDTALAGTDVPIDIVNPFPEEVRVRIDSMNVGAITIFSGMDCVENFTHEYRDRASSILVRQLASLDPASVDGTALLIRRQSPGIGETDLRVKGVQLASGGVVQLLVDPISAGQSDPTAVQWDRDGATIPDESPRLEEVIGACASGTKLVAEIDGITRTAIGASYETRATGVSPKWIAFEVI